MADRSDNAVKKTSLVPMAQRLAQAANYAIRGIKPTTWMSPGQPIEPVEQGVKGRAWDFTPGRNLWLEPRVEEAVNFTMLRNLANYCDLVRLAIETRKDQLCAMEWEIRVDDDSDIKKDDPRVAKIRKFFRRPDGHTLWPSWLRMLLEDLLVIDAPCVYIRPNLDGKPFGLEVFDGSTIKPLINEDGRTPLPPDPAYQQVLKGVPAVDFTAQELLYLPRNPRSYKVYGFSPVEQILVTIEIALRRQTHKLQYYTEGSKPDLLIELPGDWTPDQIEGFADWWYDMLAGKTGARQRGAFVPAGANPVNLKAEALKDDYDEWLARIVMFCFSLPATPFIKAHSRANDVTQRETAEDEGKLPLMNWVKDLCNLVITDYMGVEGIEFAWKSQKELDPSMQAAVDKENVTTGTRQIDEIREERGDAPLGLKPGVVTATGFVPFKPTDFEGAPDPEPPPALPSYLLPGQPLPTQPSVKPSEPQGDGAPESNSQNQGTEKLAKAHMKPIPREREQVKTHTAKLSEDLTSWFGKTAKTLAAQLSERYDQVMAQYGKADDTGAYGAATNVNVAHVVAAEVARELDLPVDEQLVTLISSTLEQMAKDGATEALKQVGVDDADIFDLANDAATEYAKERGAELVGKRWVDGKLIDNPNAQYAITETTRDQLRGYVVKAVKEGWGGKEFAQKIEQGFAFSPQRAQLIARTEVAKADVEGNMAGWHKSGVVVGKQWLLSGIHPRVDVCDDNASVGVIPLNEPFPSGDQGPPAHPACECDTIPVVGDR